MERGSKIRKSEYPVDKIFLDRWSPRAMSAEPITEEELMSLFEAAKWAPSASNVQPWRFIYAKRDTKYWNKFFNLLDDFNKMWCKNAAVLICLVSKKTKLNKESEVVLNKTFRSDAGAAWENLALQATINKLVCHGMAGFDYEKAHKELGLTDDYEIIHMIAVGKPGKLEMIHERMRKSEHPSDRKKIKEFVFEGSIQNK